MLLPCNKHLQISSGKKKKNIHIEYMFYVYILYIYRINISTGGTAYCARQALFHCVACSAEHKTSFFVRVQRLRAKWESITGNVLSRGGSYDWYYKSGKGNCDYKRPRVKSSRDRRLHSRSASREHFCGYSSSSWH